MSVVDGAEGGPSGPVSGPNPTSGPGPTLYVPGQVIAERYQLLRQLGQGGIGQVWLAKSQTLHNEVALKLFLRGGPGDGAERLLREARAAAALEHPAIVRVFDYGETDRGDPFLVMEHLKGESLDDLLRRVGPLQPSRALKLLLPILDALSLAHGKQIIHRDIKPGNLFLAVDEAQRVQPKLIDFGLARLTSGGARVTQAGILVGSPAYMSPEQIGDKEIDARSDLWSLCVVLYELVTGNVPFAGDTPFEMFKAIVEGEPQALPLGGEVDAQLVAILARGLAKKPEDRFGSARELGVAFATWLSAHGHEEDVCGASLRKEWLRPRKVSSLAPPTPAIAFVPPGLVAPLTVPGGQPQASAAELAPTQHALRAPDLGRTSQTFRPKRRWLAPLLVVTIAGLGLLAWTRFPRPREETPQPSPSAIASDLPTVGDTTPAYPSATAKKAAVAPKVAPSAAKTTKSQAPSAPATKPPPARR
jgi:serine/threonine-protein kinase